MAGIKWQTNKHPPPKWLDDYYPVTSCATWGTRGGPRTYVAGGRSPKLYMGRWHIYYLCRSAAFELLTSETTFSPKLEDKVII